MSDSLFQFYLKMQVLKDAVVRDERGQDLIECALLVSLIALGVTAAMSGAATATTSTAFGKVGTRLNTYASLHGSHMELHSLAWWPILILVSIATAMDIYCRRIPNWLVLPFLACGVLVVTASHGMTGLGQSLSGIGLAVVIAGIPCWLGGMGMGDLKLCAAVGSWIGPAQLTVALVATGITGGVLALLWAAYHGSLGKALDGSGELLSRFASRGIRPHPTLALTNPLAHTMPYAPAIAIGTLFSFLAT